MTISITTLKPGDVVYDAYLRKMGNTTVMRLGVWTVYIKEVDVDAGRVVASCNGNTPRAFYAKSGKFSWYRDNPKTAKTN